MNNGSDLALPEPRAHAAKGFADDARIVAASLILAPPIGGAFAALGFSLGYAWGLPPSPLSGLAGIAVFPLHLGFALLTGLALTIPASLFAYRIAWAPALIGGVLFATANRVAPHAWPRPALGAAAGAAAVGIQIWLTSTPFSWGDLMDLPGWLLACGVLSGAVNGWIFSRALAPGPRAPSAGE